MPWYGRASVHVNLAPTGAPDKAAIEAMLCRRPSLVANTGFAETLGRWADRLTFRHGDAADLAAKLSGVLAMAEDERAAMVAEVRERALARHSLAGLAERLVGVFREVRRPAATATCDDRRAG